MRKIDLTNYKIEIQDKDGKTKKLPYDVKNSIIEVLMSRQLQLTGREILDRDDLARKIRDCSNGAILLEDAEYTKLEEAVKIIRGFGREDVELIRRIIEAPKVEVEVKND